MKVSRTVVKWFNRLGEEREHTLFNASYHYAEKWFRKSIIECQGVLSIDERRSSLLKLISIQVGV